MNDFIKAIKRSLENKNYYSALFISLSIPDVCGRFEYPKNPIVCRYIEWFDKYMPNYSGFLSGRDCYNLRCTLFHEGSDDLENSSKKDVLQHFKFFESGPHKNLINNCIIKGEADSFLQLNVEKFCTDIYEGAELWIKNMKSKGNVSERMERLIKIYDSGYIYKETIKFGDKQNNNL